MQGVRGDFVQIIHEENWIAPKSILEKQEFVRREAEAFIQYELEDE